MAREGCFKSFVLECEWLNEYKKADDFVNILSSHDIIFLYETRAYPDSNMELDGYISHNNFKKFQNHNA